jgi:nitroimidazol reductase NimA-like FMN-containing flavoprotein (pyridoxamine 5'-phosphate oxidase superfamily)
MAKMSDAARQEFLADVHVGVLSVAGEGGRPPMSTPVFYAYQPGGDVTFFTNTQRRVSQKVARINETGVVTLVAQREEPPFAYVTVEGTVTSADAPPTEEQMLAIAGRYMPAEHAHAFVRSELDDPETTVTVFTIRPDRWLTFDSAS